MKPSFIVRGVKKVFLLTGLASLTAMDTQAQKKPNILVIFGDDVGQTNISA